MHLKAMPFKMLPCRPEVKKPVFLIFALINSMIELFLPILGVIL